MQFCKKKNFKGLKEQKNFIQKLNMDIKNAEFHADFKFVAKNAPKVICKNVTEFALFTLLMFVNFVLLISFLVH